MQELEISSDQKLKKKKIYIFVYFLFESRDRVGKSSYPLPVVDSHIIRLCALWALSSWAEGEGAGPRRCPLSWDPADMGHVTHTRFKTQMATERDLLPFLNQEVQGWQDLTTGQLKKKPIIHIRDSKGGFWECSTRQCTWETRPHTFMIEIVHVNLCAKLVPQLNDIWLVRPVQHSLPELPVSCNCTAHASLKTQILCWYYSASVINKT